MAIKYTQDCITATYQAPKVDVIGTIVELTEGVNLSLLAGDTTRVECLLNGPCS